MSCTCMCVYVQGSQFKISVQQHFVHQMWQTSQYELFSSFIDEVSFGLVLLLIMMMVMVSSDWPTNIIFVCMHVHT